MDQTIGAALRRARQRLQDLPSSSSSREASLLLGHLLGYSEAQLLARTSEPLSPEVARDLETLVARRLGGEPVAYLLGRREFYGREFYVDSRVLIPRPETEHLVEAALDTGDLPPEPLILDVGTGSGCLAVTLALELPKARVVATDLSLASLAVARINAGRHGVAERVRLVACDLLGAVELDGVSLLLSNPPYVAPEDAAALPPDVRDFEPHLALFAPHHGLAVLSRLLEEGKGLARHARVMVEIGYGQLGEVRSLAELSGWKVIREITDYGGIPRTVVFARSSEAEGKDD